MPQTFYIESDEEIISVIGRLRRSSNEENYFIFPKRSLVLQSIINLKLFQREAEKLGKKVIIVTQDEVGMMLAEKAGLATERYTDDLSRKSAHLELGASSQKKQMEENASEAMPSDNHKSEDLGSNDFYLVPQENAIDSMDKERTLRVRNASPIQQTSLNSKRVEKELTPSIPSQLPPVLSGMKQTVEMGQASPLRQNIPQIQRPTFSHGRDERLKNFFGGETRVSAFPKTPLSGTRQESTPAVVVVPHKVGGILLLLLGSVSFVSLVGVFVFLFLPKAEVHITPYKMIHNVDLQFEGQLEGVLASEDAFPVRVMEREQEVVFSVEATGVAPGTSQKARGTVVIYNKFSTDPQSLVATTRFESPEGKIFRLAEGVTVPGMVNGQAGAIEATVIADQPGVSSNIAGTTFTIPGFTGSPKFDKFSAQSNKALSGGSDATGSGLRVISKEDVEKADVTAREKAKELYLEALSRELGPGEKVLEENIDITSLMSTSLPLAGTAANSFEYKNSFQVRGFIFSESALREKIMSQGEERINDVIFRPRAMTLSHGEAIPNYEEKKLRLKVHASVDSESVIDQEKFLGNILGKDSDGINVVLASFPEIKKIQVTFKPAWFTSVIPTRKSRVSIIIEPGSAE